MKKFFGEFKKFITRGNVIDLAVGVIIGGAFTAIVTALTTNILTPLINGLIYLIMGGKQNEPVYTMIVSRYAEDGALDLASSIYIDWGAFISAIINFLLIAFILFIIVKAINKVQENNEKLANSLKKNKLTKEDKKILKERGIKLSDCTAVKAYIEEREKTIKDAQAEAEAKAKAEEEEAKKHTTEALLEQIKDLLEKQAK